MEIKYPITVYSFSKYIVNYLVEEFIFLAPPVYAGDSHAIVGNKLCVREYDINHYYYLDRNDAVEELKKYINYQIPRLQNEIDRMKIALEKI